MAVNRNQANALKRLRWDLEEIRKSPSESVSAVPLDENMLEWHCNIRQDDCVFHIILTFPDTYPFKSPSAEFVPRGFCFNGGATKNGKKGVQVCLSIFNDFAEIHTEWAKEKGTGWSAGYSVQTVLLNLVSFLVDQQYHGSANKGPNYNLCKNFKCSDCGHNYDKPYPPFEDVALNQALYHSLSESSPPTNPLESKVQIVDYISKAKFVQKAFYSRNEIFGFGIIQKSHGRRVDLTTPCEFLTAESFFGMRTAVGGAQSSLREDLKYFLPLFIHPTHGSAIKEQFEETLKAMAQALPDCDPRNSSIEDLILKTLPNLMNATVVEFSNGAQHTSDNHLSGYFALHRLFIWAMITYPKLQQKIDSILQDFMMKEGKRDKYACPNLGQWLAVLSGSTKYRWHHVADAFLSECWKRNVMWYVKNNERLGNLDVSMQERLTETFYETATSRKLVSLQVLFLDIAMPSTMSPKQILARYDANLGMPTEEMVSDMKKACELVKNMKTYQDWFKILKLSPMSDTEVFNILKNDVEFAINTPGYKFSSGQNMGGWYSTLRCYRCPTPGYASGKVRKGASGFRIATSTTS